MQPLTSEVQLQFPMASSTSNVYTWLAHTSCRSSESSALNGKDKQATWQAVLVFWGTPYLRGTLVSEVWPKFKEILNYVILETVRFHTGLVL